MVLPLVNTSLVIWFRIYIFFLLNLWLHLSKSLYWHTHILLPFLLRIPMNIPRIYLTSLFGCSKPLFIECSTLEGVSNKLLSMPSAAQFISNYSPWEASWNCPMTLKDKNTCVLSRTCQVTVRSFFRFSDFADQSDSECSSPACAAIKLFNTSYQLFNTSYHLHPLLSFATLFNSSPCH